MSENEEVKDGPAGTASSEANGASNASSPGASGSSGEAEPVVVEDPLDKARAEAAEMREKMLRVAADFDNYKKRARRDVEDAERRAREVLLKELLPVFDNLERAALHAGQATDAKAVADGVAMVLRQFTDALGRVGIRRVETVGLPFDPSVHEAIQQIASADHPAGSIIAEVQGGYAHGDKLLRAAMVVVAKAPEST